MILPSIGRRGGSPGPRPDCQDPVYPGSLTMIGQKLGSFLIEAELGSGAMGTVYRGSRETGKTRIAAVKVISSEHLDKGKMAYERFEREAKILEQFRHPNIVRYLARGKSGRTFYYAMEYVQGATLDRLIEERGALPWVDVVKFGIQIADALHYAHEHSVVHRDLKPSNLMVADGDLVKLTDFGIAKDLDATALTATGRTLGTAAYMAPEQIRGTPEVSHKTDLYSFGILLYQMLTADLPFRGTSAVVLMHCHMNEPPPRPSSKAAENIPVELDELILEMMAKDRDKRPWDAAVVGMRLRDLLLRYDTNKPIEMVWPPEGSAAYNPLRTVDNFKAAVKSVKKKKKATTADRLRKALPTVGLVVALVAVGAGIGYIVWPPSAKYLHDKAAEMMAKTQRSDWLSAESMYLDELDRRLVDYPDKVQAEIWKAQAQAWRDRIALTGAEARADVLESGVAGFKKPRIDGQGEQLYVAVYPEADAALKRRDDLDAARRWSDMAARLEKEGDKKERGWVLLSRKKADEIEATVKARTKEIIILLERANDAEQKGRPDLALRLRLDLLDRFGKYTDAAELLGPLRALPPAEKNEKPNEKSDSGVPAEPK
jgi:serine/threonine protein kinase